MFLHRKDSGHEIVVEAFLHMRSEGRAIEAKGCQQYQQGLK